MVDSQPQPVQPSQPQPRSRSDSPLVSVIVPVYNAQRFLPYCVDSILRQSYANLEIILVDDGATDDSPAICDDYAAKDGRIVVIHQPNGGIAKAQNAGLDAAHGRYLAFADNDDILDSRNIEILLHALESTGASMSKGRWSQFGVSRLDEVADLARLGAADPETVTVFRNPLRAYQSVFCKSLRLLLDAMGRHGEARYFNEANWCRLYRRELWDGVRFPEGMYAQDVMVAGELYSRMDKVADVNAVLYHWLQSGESVTHSQRSLGFYHDNVLAGLTNFDHAMANGVTPARSYYTMTEQLREAEQAYGRGDAAGSDADTRLLADDRAQVRKAIRRLTVCQRLRCRVLAAARYAEKLVYDRRIKSMR
ncbi:glycosyltransferase family 2 protein [Bifidobacterium simiarum]|uniref:glycosyltransferase family 2 protein n=1 Tax=Bifidobacterium simiarum TaxID=2045441 RepID=UPI001BDD2884|nr:glycosyltransferase [Bifidobacterium simiarum]MBT1166361.1 glycosyltransferase [Bifidobacterium simiarum]